MPGNGFDAVRQTDSQADRVSSVFIYKTTCMDSSTIFRVLLGPGTKSIAAVSAFHPEHGRRISSQILPKLRAAHKSPSHHRIITGL